jgi:RNA polymerase subunit RPABC4/transcription elongation factor Spt4
LKICEDCGKEINDDLESCPNCEKKNIRKERLLGLLIILLITGIPAMAFLGIFF